MPNKKILRSPICVVAGHVDHGKSSILDRIRGTSITATEAGGITQEIGASMIPLSTIKKVCKDLLKNVKINFEIPGLLFIDTPGHAAFQSLRKRGGNLADIAILVVDINEGFKPQTVESVDILKSYKTPFIVAANKIDLIPGWQTLKGPLLKSIAKQSEDVKRKLDEKIYNIVASLYEQGFSSERFDRVSDYTKEVGIVPVSAKTGEGIPELIMALTGLTQKYLASTLKINVEGNAKGTILEVKEVPGIGRGINAIIYNGTLRKNDTIVIGGLDKPIVTKVRGLLEPLALNETRDKHAKFKQVEEVHAASGVKIIVSPTEEEILSGMPLRSVGQDETLEKAKEEVTKEANEVLIKTDDEGIIIKADSLGSLEGLTFILNNEGINIRRASVGMITKKNIINAESNEDKNKRIILGFNTELTKDAQEYLNSIKTNVKIITNNVIYKILDDYKDYIKQLEKEEIEDELAGASRACRIRIMPQYIFRQSNPAIVGVDIEKGILKAGAKLMKEDGKEICTVKAIQVDKKNVEYAEAGKQVAVSLEGVTIGRQVDKNTILFSSLTEEEFRKLKNLKAHLKKDEIEALKEIAEIKRKENALWGI